MRKRYRPGCVWLDGKTWRFRAGEGSPSKKLGTVTEYKTKSAARKAAQRFVDEANEIGNVPVVTIGSLIARYKTEELPKVRGCTKRSYESWLDLHIYPKWGEVAVRELDAYAVKEWLESLDLAGKSKSEIRGLLKRILRCAMLWKVLPHGPNPMELVSLKGVKRKTKPRILSVGEFQALAGCLEEPFRTMACVALNQALRVSELLGLKWGDVNWLEKTISIQRSIVNQVEDRTKTPASEAVRPLEDAEILMLMNHRTRSEFTKATDYIFASPNLGGDKPYHYTSVMWKLEKACERAGITKVGTHTFRHTARAWAGELGIPLAVIKDMHRHEDIATTMNVYGGTVPETLREAHKKLVSLTVR